MARKPLGASNRAPAAPTPAAAFTPAKRAALEALQAKTPHRTFEYCDVKNSPSPPVMSREEFKQRVVEFSRAAPPPRAARPLLLLPHSWVDAVSRCAPRRVVVETPAADRADREEPASLWRQIMCGDFGCFGAREEPESLFTPRPPTIIFDIDAPDTSDRYDFSPDALDLRKPPRRSLDAADQNALLHAQ